MRIEHIAEYLDKHNLEVIDMTKNVAEDDLIIYTWRENIEVCKYSESKIKSKAMLYLVVKPKPAPKLVFEYDGVRLPKQGELFLKNGGYNIAKIDFLRVEYPTYKLVNEEKIS